MYIPIAEANLEEIRQNAIDIDAPISHEQLSRMLVGLKFICDNLEFFDPFSPDQVRELKNCNEILCNYLQSSADVSLKKALVSQLRELIKSVAGKKGNAQFVFLAFPNIHEAQDQEFRKNPRSNRLTPQQGW